MPNELQKDDCKFNLCISLPTEYCFRKFVLIHGLYVDIQTIALK